MNEEINMIDSNLSVEELTDCQIKTNKTVHFAEHEIFLSFTNDDGAVAFETWWNSLGKKQFLDWVSYWTNKKNS